MSEDAHENQLLRADWERLLAERPDAMRSVTTLREIVARVERGRLDFNGYTEDGFAFEFRAEGRHVGFVVVDTSGRVYWI